MRRGVVEEVVGFGRWKIWRRWRRSCCWISKWEIRICNWKHKSELAELGLRWHECSSTRDDPLARQHGGIRRYRKT